MNFCKNRIFFLYRCEVLHGKILDMSKVFPEDYDMLMPPKENGLHSFNVFLPLLVFID
jgi:hypothetical protein